MVACDAIHTWLLTSVVVTQYSPEVNPGTKSIQVWNLFRSGCTSHVPSNASSRLSCWMSTCIVLKQTHYYQQQQLNSNQIMLGPQFYALQCDVMSLMLKASMDPCWQNHYSRILEIVNLHRRVFKKLICVFTKRQCMDVECVGNLSQTNVFVNTSLQSQQVSVYIALTTNCACFYSQLIIGTISPEDVTAIAWIQGVSLCSVVYTW
jgi:hypothetical protein